MLFSVIVPVYNSHQYIEDCLNSVIRQSFADFEVVIVDDGSTDSSLSICQKYLSDSRCRIIRHSENRGAAAARNTGIAEARGDYVLFLDNDDWWDDPNALMMIAFEIERYRSPDLLCFPMGEYYEDSDSLNLSVVALPDGYGPHSSYYDLMGMMVSKGYFYSSASGKAVKRSLIVDSHLEFDATLKYNEDSEWSRLLLKNASSAGWLDRPFYIYRKNSSVSQSSSPDNLAVLECLRCIVNRHIDDVESGIFDRKRESLVSSFVSYLFALMMAYIGMVPREHVAGIVEEQNRNLWLLNRGTQTTVRCVNLCCKVLGFRLTARILASVMLHRQKAVLAGKR